MPYIFLALPFPDKSKMDKKKKSTAIGETEEDIGS